MVHSIEQQFTVSYSYPVIFTRDAFGKENLALRDLVCRSGRNKSRVLIILDREVARLTPPLLENISSYGQAHDALQFVAPPYILPGGEDCKNDGAVIEKIHALIERHHLCRHSYLLAIGGGAVLDATGYAAATAHRGMRLIRMPTTVLSQNDAGIGVKNGVNAFGRKNFVGTFAPPFGVINDFAFLSTLQPRDLRAGIAEAVKVALIRDRPFFDDLYRLRHHLAVFEASAMEAMIVRCAELHLQHISAGGDPFESGSSRPLDFGHWSAHKLEALTHNELRHGEAVAIGMALDSLYSFLAGYLPELQLHRILTLLGELGFDLYHPALSWLDVERSIEEFREHLGGQLTIPLISRIGVTVEAHSIDAALVKRCIAMLAQRTTRQWEGEKTPPHPVPPLEREGTL